MPIYEYSCPKCNCTFELLRSINKADEGASCPTCHQTSRRVFSRFAAFSKGIDLGSVPLAGTGSSCSGCSSTNCSSCHM